MKERPNLFNGTMIRALLDGNPWVWAVKFKRVTA